MKAVPVHQPLEDREGAFRVRRAVDNLNRLQLICIVYIGVVLWFAAVNGAAVAAGSRVLVGIEYYSVLYTAFFAFNVYTLLRVKRLRRRATVAVENVHRYERIVVGYSLITMVLGAFISLADQSVYGHVMVYTMTLLLSSTFLLTDAKHMLLPMFVSLALLVVGLPMRIEPSKQLHHVLQELFAYAPIAFVVSRLLHSSYRDAFFSNLQLQQQIVANEELNERLQKANHRLESLALLDDVTEIANRRGLNEHLERLLAASPHGVRVAVIMIDIDCFKEYNDLYGHDQGDQVLSRVARVLARIAKEHTGFVARWGGEEFIYVAEGKDRDETIALCKLIHDAVLSERIYHGNSLASEYLTVSQGACSQHVQSRSDIQECIRMADRALYWIKDSGRNGYAYCDFAEKA